MKNKVILVGLLLVIIVVMGCTVNQYNQDEVILHPENYLNQEVIIKANPMINLFINPYTESFKFNYEVKTEDKEGKPFSLNVEYLKFYCDNCEITGIIKKIDVCDCLNEKDNNQLYVAQEVIDYCNNFKEPSWYLEGGKYSCIPNTEISIYYLEVTDIIKLN